MKKTVLVLAALTVTIGRASDGFEVLGSAESPAVELDLTTAIPSYQTVEAPFELDVDLVPGVSQTACNGVLLATGATDESCTWRPNSGLQILTHQPLVDGAAFGPAFAITCAVWAADAVLDRTDIPLKEQLPAKYTEVRSVTFVDGVTEICDGFFDDCVVTSVTYPNTLESFGYDNLPPSAQTTLSYDTNGFMIYNGWVLDYEDKTTSSLTVPEGVIGIGHGALAQMYDLENVTLPSTLKYIAQRAFADDTYLDNVVIPDGVEVIGNGAFRDCSYIQTITFGNGLKTVGREAFSGCTQLSRVAFSEGLETIGAKAFEGCWRMQSVALPLSLESVADDAFTGCSSLTGVTVPTHGGKMSEWFKPIYSQIVNVTIPGGETEIRDSMFSDCTALVTATLPEGITNVAREAFYNCSRLSTAALPRSTEAVGASAFRGCTSLTAVVLPENVSSLGAYAYYGCSYLNDLTLSRSLTEIPDYAFANCSRLGSFVVPEGVTRLGRNICASSVTAIYFLGNAPEYDANVYASTQSGLQTYVINGTKGWDGRPQSRDLPARWPVDNSYSRAISFWTANQFDVAFDANGGIFALGATNVYACGQITYTAYALPPYQPVRGGYRFNGYWTEPSGGTRVTASTAVKLTKSHTLYAQWTVAPSITARFNAMGGTVEPGTRVYTSGEPYAGFPVPTREHYEFDGWYDAANGGRRVTEASEAPNADTEFFARWRPKLYEILYHSNNGADTTASRLFTYGDPVTLIGNPFYCSGCTFTGWALTPGGEPVYAAGKTLGEISAVQDGTIHLYATWTGRTYAVRFDSNGGTGAMPNQTFVLDVGQAVSINRFVREGYVFRGWALTPSGEATVEDGAMAIGLAERQGDTVVLYAVWARDGYSLEEALGGSGVTLAVSGDADWVTDTETTHDGLAAVETAALEAAEEGETVSTTLAATIRGSGSGSFWWKVNCEEAYFEDWYDYAVFAVDGVEQARIAGDRDWTKVAYEIAANGVHTLTWTFVRDDFDEVDAVWENRLWVDDFVWERDLASYTVPDVLDAPELVFTTGGDAVWTVDAVTNHDGLVGMTSGTIGHSQETWIETTLSGAGELSFWWKAMGQVNGSRLYDYVKCELDGDLVCRAGLADWTNVVVAVTNAGTHTVRWTYLKNASVNPDYDRAWLDEVTWKPAAELQVIVPAGVTGAADILIPPAWFGRYPRFVELFGSDRTAAMLRQTGKRGPGGAPRCVWHDFVAGTDPTDDKDDFTVSIETVNGGMKLTWHPDLNEGGTKSERQYRIWGRESLTEGDWECPTNALHRFFKVTVDMK